MKYNLPQRPNPSAPTDPAFLSRHAETVSNIIQRNVSFGDNIAGALMTVALAHGVPTLVANPLPQNQTPVGVQVFGCDTQLNPSVTYSKSAMLDGKLVTAPTGKIFLTALYPLTDQFGFAQQATAQVLTTGIGTTVTMASQVHLGSNVVWNAATNQFTVSVAGLYQVSAGVVFAANVTSGRLCWIRGTGLPVSDVALVSVQANANAGDISALSTNVFLQLAAKTSFALFAQHESGVNLSTFVSTLAASYLQVRQLSNDASLTANVTLFVVGS